MKRGSYGSSPNNSRSYGASPGGKYEYLMDMVPGAFYATSVRLLNQNYAGGIARLRRPSDNNEQDAYPAYNKFITPTSSLTNGQALESWITTEKPWGAKWLDQSGNGLHATQTTAARQPELSFTQHRHASWYEPAGGKESIWTHGTNFNPYLYGADVRFTISFALKGVVGFVSSEFLLFRHVNTGAGTITGLDILLKGDANTSYVSVRAGGGANSCQVDSATFSNASKLLIVLMYDGTADASWLSRFKLYVNNNPVAFNLTSQTGVFPADTVAPAISFGQTGYASFSGGNFNFYEMVAWPRLLTGLEPFYVFNNCDKAYGL